MSDAEILDRGYRRYEGRRGGTAAAMRSLAVMTVRQALGLRRSARHKVLPILAIAVAYVPAIVFVGTVSLLDTDEMRAQGEFFLPSYGEYYGFVITAIILFTSFVSPEVLCGDRRSGMLGLYLASPLSRDTYLLAKAGAVAAVLSTVTLGPPLLMLVANTIEGVGPGDVTEFAAVLANIITAGVVVTTMYTTFSLAVASLTTRRAAASAGIILVLAVGTSIVGTLITEADAPGSLFVLDLASLPIELVARIYGDIQTLEPALGVPTWWLVAGYAIWTGGCAVFLRVRYQHVTVTR